METSFNLLELPAEIRNLIYNFVFQPQEFEINWLKKRKSLTYRAIGNHSTPDYYGKEWQLHRQRILERSPNIIRRRRQLDLPRRLRSSEADIPLYKLSPGPAALLLTCRQVRSEANAIFYGNHAFHLTSRNVLTRFLSSLTRESKAAIKSLRIWYNPMDLYW